MDIQNSVFIFGTPSYSKHLLFVLALTIHVLSVWGTPV